MHGEIDERMDVFNVAGKVGVSGERIDSGGANRSGRIGEGIGFQTYLVLMNALTYFTFLANPKKLFASSKVRQL